MWNFDAQKPIYCQLVEQFRLKILSGEYPPGSKVPPVRELAQEACVNPNTMQRAFTELERAGLVYTQRTSGRFITDDAELIARCRSEAASTFVRDFISNMERIGIERDQLFQELNMNL